MNINDANLFLPLVQALADGKTLQYKSCDGWRDMDSNGNISFGFSPEDYRIKEEPAPPVMVPLEADDVPVGSVIAWTGDESRWSMITTVTAFGVGTVNNTFDYERLKAECKIKRPGEDFQPCHKPAP